MTFRRQVLPWLHSLATLLSLRLVHNLQGQRAQSCTWTAPGWLASQCHGLVTDLALLGPAEGVQVAGAPLLVGPPHALQSHRLHASCTVIQKQYLCAPLRMGIACSSPASLLHNGARNLTQAGPRQDIAMRRVFSASLPALCKACWRHATTAHVAQEPQPARRPPDQPGQQGGLATQPCRPAAARTGSGPQRTQHSSSARRTLATVSRLPAME